MKKINIITILLAIIISTGSMAQVINEKESIVTFKLMNRGSEVVGTIGGMKGEIKFDAKDLKNSSFKTSIDPNTINTGVEKRDNHLRQPDFFDIKIFPTIDFESTGITELKDGSFVADGKLSMHGVSKDVNIKFTVEETKKGAQIFTGTLNLDHGDYGIGESRNVNIEIVCVLK